MKAKGLFAAGVGVGLAAIGTVAFVIGKGKSKKEESVDTGNLDDAREDDSDESGDADTPTEDAGEDNESDDIESSETTNETY